MHPSFQKDENADGTARHLHEMARYLREAIQLVHGMLLLCRIPSSLSAPDQ